MEISILLAGKICSMLLACFVGFLIVRVKLVKVTDSKILSTILAFVCSPCAIVSAYQIEFTIEKALGLLMALVMVVVLHVVYIGGAKGIGKILKLENLERASIIYSNAGYLTIPIVYAVLGPEWVFYTCAYSVVQTILLWTHCRSLLCENHVVQWKKVIWNPNFIAIYVGITVFITGWEFPTIIADGMSDFSGMIGPMSMLIIGMLMGVENIPDMLRTKRIYMICLLRLFVMPLLTMLILGVVTLFVSHPDLHNMMLIILWAASGPVGSTVTQLTQIYGQDDRYAGRLTLVSVLLCVISMPLVTALFELIFI